MLFNLRFFNNCEKLIKYLFQQNIKFEYFYQLYIINVQLLNMKLLSVNNKSFPVYLLSVFLVLFVTNLISQNLEDITLTITFENAPTDFSVTKAPLKYNKKFALSMQIDDGSISIYNYGFPVFEGGQVGTTTYPGMKFTDGCGNFHSFKMTSSVFIFSGVGTDLHNDPNSNFITWEQLNTLHQNNWGIANHGVNSDAFDIPEFINYSIARNRSYIRKKLYNSKPGGVITSVFVNPNGNSNWTEPAFSMGNICALNEGNSGPFGDYGGNVNNPALNWAQNKYNLFRSNTGNRNVTDLVDSLAKFSSNGANYWCPIYTHSIFNDYLFADFVADFEYINNTYGSNGTDEILMISDEEILDYLAVRDAITINSNLSGKNLTLTFSGSLPNNLLYYASSIIINSNEIITDISIGGTEDFTVSNVGDTSALVNLNWDEFVVPSAEELATTYTSTAVSTQAEYDALVAMDYVSVLDYSETKINLVNQLCEIPGVEYDEGFCNSGSPDFVSITGDTIILTGEESTLTATTYLKSYLWNTGQTTQSIVVSPQTDTKYWVDAVTYDDVNVSDTVIVTVSDSYILQHSPLYIEHTLGEPDSLWVTLKDGASSSWSTGSTLNYIIVNPEVSTNYKLDVLVDNNIVNQIEFNVYIANIIEFTYDSVCFGDSTTLINTSVVNDTITKVVWDLNGDTQFDDAEGDTVKYVFNNSGNHLVGMRIYFKTDPMDVVYNAVPVGDLPNVDFDYTSTCVETTTMFNDISTVQVGTIEKWYWQFGDGNTDRFKNTSNYYSDPGNYNVVLTVTSTIGCKDSLKKIIKIYDSPNITLKKNSDTIIGNNDTVYFEKGGTVTILVSNFSSYDSVIWFDDSRAETVVLAEEGSYYINVYRGDCNAKQNFFTSWGSGPTPPPPVGNKIMNLFTPNGDGFNDLWLVNDPNIVSPANVTIYNRAGNQIYSNSNYQNTWDGQFEGNPLPQATYYYIIKDASDQIIKGAVTIIR